MICGDFSDAAVNVGANMRHGPHQPAQKSTSTMALSLMVASKVFSMISMVAVQ